MSKNIATLALAAALSAATVIPTTTTAEARDGRNYRNHHAHNHGHHRHHRGRGYWKNGKWIALGIIGAAAAAAIANSDRDCYYRHGRRYCDY